MATQTLSAAGSTTPIPLTGTNVRPQQMLVGVFVGLSAGASLTYSVQVTGDDVFLPGYNPSTGNWFNFDTLTAQTASANGTLTVPAKAIRATITSYVSGTLTIQVVQ